MIAWAVIATLTILTLGAAVKRCFDGNRMHWLLWPTLVLSTVPPVWVAYTCLYPPAPVTSVEVKAQGDVVQLELIEGHHVMVTAELSPESDEPNTDKTAYSLHMQGDPWSQSLNGSVARENAGSGPDVDVIGGAGISESGKRRQGGFSENFQDRFEPKGLGKVELRVKNWQGKAAEKLVLDVIKGPPPEWQVWILVIIVGILGVYLEVRHECERLAGDVGFIALWGVFMRDHVTPLDVLFPLARSVLPAALIGWLAVGGVAYLILKYKNFKLDKAEAEAEAAAEAEAEQADLPVEVPEEAGLSKAELRRRRIRAQREAEGADP